MKRVSVSSDDKANWHFHSTAGSAVADMISAASIIPIVHKTGREGPMRFAVVQVQDEVIDGRWTPALSMLGGKVEPTDCHWVETIARELEEEVGEAREAIRPLIDRLRSTLHDPTLLQTEHRASSTYVVSSKHEVMFLPVDLSEVKDLPGAFYREIDDVTIQDCPGPREDCTRAGHFIVWAEIVRLHSGFCILRTSLDDEVHIVWLQDHKKLGNKKSLPSPIKDLSIAGWVKKALAHTLRSNLEAMVSDGDYDPEGVEK